MVIDKIEKAARESHGLMYDITWRARETNQKWLWGVVLAISLVQFIGLPTLVGVMSWLIISFIEKNAYSDTVSLSGAMVVGWFVFMSPYVHALLDVKSAFRNTSQFISVAGDMNRVANSSANLFTKLISKMIFVFSGAIAVYCALGIWAVYKRKLKSLLDTELDVLGNALANGKFFWGHALAIYHLMSARYNNSLQKTIPDMQVAVSFAFACKWMLGDPSQSPDLRQWRKETIARILKDYEGSLPPQVTMRLCEVF